jgi:biopolymer transport protein ExbB
MQSPQRKRRMDLQRYPSRTGLYVLGALVVLLLLAHPGADAAWAQSATAPAATAPQSVTTPANQPTSPATAPSPSVQPATPEPATTAPAAASSPPPFAPAVAPRAAGEPAIGGDLLPRQLSYTRMFLDADWVVKAVMIGLAFASLVTWTVWLAKTWELAKARLQLRRDVRMLLDAPTLAYAHEQLRKSGTAAGQLMQSAAQEIRLSANVRGDGLKERIALQLERLEMAFSRRMSRGTGVLATIGSTAPFVGLFGTVWGIMNSFIGISNAHTTNLAVVAPGIAQALMATAMGLIAAIPAVMIYNVLARQTAQYRALLGDASAQVMRLVSRDLDRARLPLAQAAE